MLSRKEKLQEIILGFQIIRKNIAFAKFCGIDSTITPSQWMVLRIIDQQDKTSIKDIAKELDITSSAATQLTDGLVRSGYVVKKEDNKDKRLVMVYLSQKVKKQVAGLKKQAIDQLLLVFSALNDKEFNQYYSLHKKIVNKLHEN